MTVFVLDGATGTELDRRGVDIGLPLWSAGALIHAPGAVVDVHRAYLKAGADAITANTFRTHERSLLKGGISGRAEELTAIAVTLACQARCEMAPKALVLGSVAPLEDCYCPDRSPDAEICREEHEQIMIHLMAAGVDFVLIETMSAATEAMAAVSAARAVAPGAWAISFCFRSSGPPGVLLDGTPIEKLSPYLGGARFVGVNCVAAPQLSEHIAAIRAAMPAGTPVAAYGNVGYATDDGAWVSTDAVNPDRFAQYAMNWVESGATWVGGCCGTSPHTIRAMAEHLAQRNSPID